VTVTYPDTLALPVIQDALACLCEAATLNPAPPAACCLRPYINGTPMFGASRDECCDGLAFLYFGPAYPSRQGFPAHDGDPVSCGITWAMTMQLGIWRCAPIGTISAAPTCADWNTISGDLLDDFATLRDALCCFTNQRPQKSIFVDEWGIINDGPEGACIGSSVTIRVQLGPKKRT
jgi:hypothetical protein